MHGTWAKTAAERLVEDSMYQWLSEAVENDSIVITASRRLARHLNAEHGKAQLASGNTAWRSPPIQFLDDWLSSCINAAADDLPIILSGHSSDIIWERCLQGEAGELLLDIGVLVRQVRQAWRRVREWRVPLAEVLAAARSRDERLFAVAAGRYEKILADHRWVDGAQVLHLATELIECGVIPVPGRLVHAGFDRLVPAIERLFTVLSDRACAVTAAPTAATAGDVRIAVFDDAIAELRAAGAWARRELSENPLAKIGIICSNLDKNAAAAERLVKEGLAPGWQYGDSELQAAVDTSYGQRLSAYPAVGIALLLLQWLHRDLSFEEVSVLLRTQFVAGDETAGRCKLELRLRRLPDQPWSPYTVVRLLRGRTEEADAVSWLQGVEYLGSLRPGTAEKASPAAWADNIDRLLRRLGWPRTKSLASDEFQLVNRWRELLNDLARLLIVCPTMSFAEASSRLAAFANESIYQPEKPAAVVQLLGPLEAAGMRFDALWVAGLDADTWPPPAHPLSLVSRQLQRRYSMPDATPDDTLLYSRRVIKRLLASAGTVRLSWPRASEESDNTISSLIDRFQDVDPDRLTDPGWHASSLIGSVQIEQVVDDAAPPIRREELVAGGAYIVQQQVADPFSAFARGRLRVSELAPVTGGLSPAFRGSVIHEALRTLFAEAPTQMQIRQWSAGERRQRVLRAARSALSQYRWHADPVLRRLLDLEQARIGGLLEKFIVEELRRPAFRVDAVEHRLDYRQFGVRLNLRVDRIDRLPDGGLLIVDYKTGQAKTFLTRDGEPNDLQLVVYACALNDDVSGLVLVNIDSRSIVYKGADANGQWDPKHADRWPQTLAAWKKKVADAMRQIAAGDVRINLNLSSDQARPLNILCRFEERKRA